MDPALQRGKWLCTSAGTVVEAFVVGTKALVTLALVRGWCCWLFLLGRVEKLQSLVATIESEDQENAGIADILGDTKFMALGKYPYWELWNRWDCFMDRV